MAHKNVVANEVINIVNENSDENLMTHSDEILMTHSVENLENRLRYLRAKTYNQCLGHLLY